MCPGPGLLPGVQEVGISSSGPLRLPGGWHLSCDLLGKAPGARQTAGCSPVLSEGFGPQSLMYFLPITAPTTKVGSLGL